MIDIELFEQEIIKVLSNDAEAIAAHREITQDEEKIAALDTLRNLAHVESYQGNIDEILIGNIIPFPAALVIYGGFEDENKPTQGGAKGSVNVSFGIFVVGQNLMGSKDSALDVRKFLTAIRTVLNGIEYRKRTLLLKGEVLGKMTNTGTCAYEQTYSYEDWLIS